MATKIAPIFGPPAGTVQWLRDCIERGKRETFVEHVTLSPALAAILLEANPDNRSLRTAKLQQFAQDIRNGRWVFNGEPIILSKDGLLNDGQHRCHAIVEANRSIPALIVFGIDRETRTTVDQGSARGAADYLGMKGAAHATILASAGRLLVAYERNDGDSVAGASYVSNADIMKRVEGDERLAKSAAFADTNFKHSRQYIAPSLVAFCHYILSSIHPGDADTYMRQVCIGESLRRKDPAYAVRERLLSAGRTQRDDKIEIVLRGWVAFRQGRNLSLAKVLGSFPALV